MGILEKGEFFNEASESRDRMTGRLVRRLTCAGEYNQPPTYHTNTAFTADSKHLIFAMARDGQSAIASAELATGNIRILAVADGIGTNKQANRSLGPYIPGSQRGGFTGCGICLAPESNWIAAPLGKKFMAVHHDTLEERVFIDEIGPYVYGAAGTSLDGSKAAVTYAPEHPDLSNGQWPIQRSYQQAMAEDYQGRPTTYIQADFKSGDIEEVFTDNYGCNHVQPSFAYPDVWLIDRDPMTPEQGDRTNHPRVWLLNISDKSLTPVVPRNNFLRPIHATWNRTGDRVYYHGRAEEGGQYLGVADINGNILWERLIPGAVYGHVSAHTGRDAIISDGLFAPDMITAIDYHDDKEESAPPRIELLGAHDTDWKGMQWQYSHPHSQMSPDGRWVYYNRCERGRSDIYVLRVDE